MTSASKLESLTDRAQFERIATSVLRKSEPKYAAIIQTGVNAEGETIVAPIDGLHLIPYSDPPHYVFVQHTTTDRAGLRTKWLSEIDGDIEKAASEARSVRQQGRPDAVVTVVLTTNQRLDSKLVLDVYKRAQTENVIVDIWEQFRLADFLDTTADGQWLRKCYLNVEATRLSAGLLHRIGRMTVELYRREVLPPGNSTLVPRRAIDAVLDGVGTQGRGLCLLVGRSGFGKSVVAIQALERWLESGALGLWLPATVFGEAASLEMALDKWMCSVYPNLQRDAGRVAIGLATMADRLLVCVDDINRMPDAGRLLRLAARDATHPTSAPTGASDGGVQSGSPVSLIVPVWPEQLSSPAIKLGEQPGVHTVYVGSLLLEESTDIISKTLTRSSPTELRDYAVRLGQDPFLVGLFALMADDRMECQELRSVADNVIGTFVDARLRTLISTRAADLLVDELRRVLSCVAHEMLVRRRLRPSWSELEDWLGEGSHTLPGLRAFVQQGEICRLDSENRLEFRHDRLRDWFLASAVTDLLRLPTLPEEVVVDPYYTSIVGEALARTEVPIDHLSRLKILAPWVLFEAIRQAGDPSNEHQRRLFREARAWAASDSQAAPESLVAAISWSLLETDSNLVLPIIDAIEPNYLLMAAGLRNGSVTHGMRFIRGRVRHDFEPGGGDALRDRIIEHSRRHHEVWIVEQLRGQLSRYDLTALDSNAYLALLGHLGLAGFDELILRVWKQHQDEVLPYALWAAVRCPLEDTERVLTPLMDRLATLPVREDKSNDPTERDYLTLYLGWGFRRGTTREAVLYMLQRARREEQERPDIARMLEGVDDPDAAEFLVRHLASGGSSNLWMRLRLFGDAESKVLSWASRTTDRLRALWETPEESKEVRVNAFALWLRTSKRMDPHILRAIRPVSPLYRYSVEHRVKLGDFAAVESLISLLRSSDLRGSWWVIAYRVWCTDLRSLASETLAGLGGSIPEDFSGGWGDLLFHLAEMLVRIPVDDAEVLLRTHWAHLKYSPLMIHAAYRVGTSKCTVLAEEALALCPPNIRVFDLAFSAVWPRGSPANPITLRHLKSLEPHLHRMTKHDLLFLALETERMVGSDAAVADWIRVRLIPLLRAEDRRGVRVADEYLVEHLDRNLEDTGVPVYLGYLFEHRGGQNATHGDRRLAILGRWLSEHNSVRALQIVAECLRYVGTRASLEILDQNPIHGEPAEVARVKADAKFSVYKRTVI